MQLTERTIQLREGDRYRASAIEAPSGPQVEADRQAATIYHAVNQAVTIGARRGLVML